MKISWLHTASEAELLQRYTEAAKQYRVTAAGKDFTAAEEYAATLANIYQELKSRGKKSQNALLALLDHEDPAVQRWSGAHSLEFAPGMGKPVLEKLAQKGSGVLCEDARKLLREWYKTHIEILK